MTIQANIERAYSFKTNIECYRHSINNLANCATLVLSSRLIANF